MRYYRVTDAEGTVRSLPSVTTILDATMPLEQRAKLEQARAGKPASFFRKQGQGRDRGNYIHKYAAAYVKQRRRIGHGQYSPYLRRLDPWLKSIREVNTGLCWFDEEVYDCDRGYAGTFDFLLYLPDEPLLLTLCDLKTTAYKAWPSAIHSAQLQAAAYAAAWNQHQCALRAARIASIHVSPYSLHIEINEGEEMNKLIEEFYGRLKQFGSRVTAAMDDCG